MADSNGDFGTTIGSDAVFSGDISFDKGLRVMGQFQGKIKTKGQLHVSEGGKVKADVDAGSIQIDGEVKGNLRASKRIHLSASSKLEGDLQTSRLEVADGAVFVGNCQVGPQGSESKSGGNGKAEMATESAKRTAVAAKK